jgi:nitroreductase
MEFNEVVKARRSVRAYDSSKKVTSDMVKEIVETASLAPSWKNSQTARYYAVISDEMVKKFSEECLPEFNAKNSAGASLIVTTFVHNRSGYERDGAATNEVGNGWGFYDLGMHNENFVLKAKDMGLDTLVMGIRDETKIREMLNIPETETVVSVIALGYGAVKPDMPKRKETEEILKIF